MGLDTVIWFKSKTDNPRFDGGGWPKVFELKVYELDKFDKDAIPEATHGVGNFWRYYGKSYERGPWPWISAVLMMLLNSPDVEKVWYGNDCTDYPNEFTVDDLVEHTRHFVEFGERPYRGPWAEPNPELTKRRSLPMTEILKPCPFCGSNKIQVIPNESETEQASCNRCGASGSPVLCGSGQAITEWNRRAAAVNGWDALKEKCERYEAELKKLAAMGGEDPGDGVSALDDVASAMAYGVKLTRFDIAKYAQEALATPIGRDGGKGPELVGGVDGPDTHNEGAQ